jgi:CRP/FNR family transcriptional regulator, cyclic AMP receptor protein
MTTEITIFDRETDFETIRAGNTIIAPGDPTGYMYVIIEGEVEVYFEDKFLHVVGRGGCVGEMALIDSQPRTGTVKAKTDCKLVRVDENRFKFMVQQHPFFALQVMKILVGRLREATAMGIQYL